VVPDGAAVSPLRHRSFVVARMVLDGEPVSIHYGDLVVAAAEGTTSMDWELVVMATDRAPVPHGAHRLDMATAEGRELQGDAIVVRSVEGTHVFRGAGPLAGVRDDELE
jgi:hypothetical protein